MSPAKRLTLVCAVIAVAVLGSIAWIKGADVLHAAAFSKVQDAQPPLTVDQVTALLGRPDRIDHSETTGLTGDAYHYVWNGNDHLVIFVNNTVFKTELVSGAKS